MDLSSIGEFGLIDRIRRFEKERAGLVQGIGDDAAVLKTAAGRYTLLTADMLVAGVHFLPGTAGYEVGRKAMAVNVSDIAAMGGYPTWAVVSIGLPRETPPRWVEDLYRGLSDEGDRWRTSIIGGDTVAAPVLAVNVALLGEVEPQRVVRRSGALVGDLLCVTHSLGEAAAGLELVRRPELDVPRQTRDRLILRHLRPTPRLDAGRELSAGLATAMIDLSDGLAGDLMHICRASGVGALVHAGRLPISDDVRAVARAAGKDALAYALGGGEDYELLFSTSRRGWQGSVLPRSGAAVTVIGEILAEHEGVLLEVDGERQPLAPAGFTHF